MELRKYRILNMAIFDYVATFIIVFLIHWYMWNNAIITNKNERTYTQYFASLLLLSITAVGLGVIAHYIFGIQSALSGYLGFNDKK
jgi:hypothetical protein